MGDLLIHEGAPLKAQKAAAKIYNADKTYFVLNGTSASNKVVLNAALTPGDLVLYDRNNHKSGITALCCRPAPHRFILKPRVIRSASSAASMKNALTRSIFATSSEKSVLRKPMPSVRSALPSSSSALTTARFTTQTGRRQNRTSVRLHPVRLCWVGYEQFIPMMRDCSPLLLELGPEDPGIFVTQPVHNSKPAFLSLLRFIKRTLISEDRTASFRTKC